MFGLDAVAGGNRGLIPHLMSGDPSFPRSSPHDGGRWTRPGVWEVRPGWVGGGGRAGGRWLYNDGEELSMAMSRARGRRRRRWLFRERDEIDKIKINKNWLASTSLCTIVLFLSWGLVFTKKTVL